MKKSLLTAFVAVPLLSMSAMSFASEPVSLSSAQMDTISAGTNSYTLKFSSIRAIQINALSPVTVVQANVLNLGGTNSSGVQSGNFIRSRQ